MPVRSNVRRRPARRSATQAAALAVLAAVAAASLSATAVAHEGFVDVSSSSSHKDNVEALNNVGLFDGTECGARKLCPDDPAKRWTVAVWIVRAVDGADPAAVRRSRFADVDPDEWWAPYVERLADLGVTQGCRQRPLRYCPDGSVNRGQMASLLVRAFDLPNARSAGFTDTRGSTHESNIDALYAAGVTIGCGQRPLRYCPTTPVKRAQMATLLRRGMGDAGTDLPGGSTGGSISVGEGARSDDFMIAAVRGRTCAVRSSGEVACWGGDEGYLEHLSASELDDVEFLSTGDHPSLGLHSCAVHTNGDVSCWGPGSEGQLGQGDTSAYHLPARVFGISDAVAVAAGPGFSCALHDNGDVSCWGDNESGQLGDGSREPVRDSPERVRGLTDGAAIAAGEDHSCVIHDGGSLSCWGRVYGNTPAEVRGLSAVSAVSIGDTETCVVTTAGAVYCWHHGETNIAQSARVGGLSNVVDVSVGGGTVCALHRDGGVSCWGRNDVGQVGDGSTTRRHTPVRVSGISDAVAVSITGGAPEVGAHACAVHDGGAVSCWGGNDLGQLGDGTLTDRPVPTRVDLPDPVPTRQIPADDTQLLLDWMDAVVDNWEAEFPWLADAWDHVRDTTDAGPIVVENSVTVVCRDDSGSGPFGCEVTAMAIAEMGLVVVHQLAHVYDLHTGLAVSPRTSSRPGSTIPWGAVQLYFASAYPDCFSDSHPGAEILADTMLHVAAPHARLDFYDSGECRRLRRAPTAQAEEVVLDALAGRIPQWYLDNVDNGSDLWTLWLRGPSLPALANLEQDVGGLCDTAWITYPLDSQEFPLADTNPFSDGGC